MELSEFLTKTHSHIAQLQAILGRFVEGHNSLTIADDDESVLHRLVIELRDLFQDALGTSDYGQMVVDSYNKGRANFYESASYASVQELISIVQAANTRVKSNPQLLLQTASPSSKPSAIPLTLPEKVTPKWLFTHVPFSLLLSFAGLLLSSFVLGATAVYKLQIVQQWFGLHCTG